MSKYATSARADADLLDIYLYGMEFFGRRQAMQYLEELYQVFSLLAQTPRMGRPVPAIDPKLRRHEHGAHIVFYEETALGILILAVVHASSVRKLPL